MTEEAGQASVLALRLSLARRVALYGAHVLAEKVRPPRVREQQDVPASYTQLTPEYLTKVLCAGTPGARVTSMEFGPPNEGTTSRRTMTVSYNSAGMEAGLPTALFTKASTSFTSRVLTGLLSLIDSEAAFYNQIRPGLDIEAARSYHAVFDKRSARSMFILEDVATTKGATFGNPASMRVDRAMAESMVSQMATYHAVFWGGKRLDGPEFDWLTTPLQWQRWANAGVSFPRRAAVGLKRSEGIVPAELLRRRADIFPTFMRSLENVTTQITLLHSDVHLGNWYVTAAGQMGQHDWQAICRGPWAVDLSYAMCAALAVEDRRAWEVDLLRLYLDRLKAAGVNAPTWDQAWLAYRQQMMRPLLFWLYTIGYGPLQPDMQPRDVCEAHVHRMAHAVVDLGSLDLL
jgi:hypothetical protein